ncbi:MAG: flagellar motor protein MotB [Desulfovibrionaceae bacterium]
MAKKQKCPPLALWLLTFSDLTTLLLTFFVLLLTMSSMDQSFITQVTLSTKDLGVLPSKGAGKVSVEAVLVSEIMERPWEVLEKQQRIKDLLFPEEQLPKDVTKSTLDQNMEVLVKDDGVALVLTDKLLFPSGGAGLDDGAKALLDRIRDLLTALNDTVTIAGYADDREPDPFRISGDRALAVLGYLVSQGVPRERFTLSAYGPYEPLDTADTDQARSRNRRIEILVRTRQPLSGYPF